MPSYSFLLASKSDWCIYIVYWGLTQLSNSQGHIEAVMMIMKCQFHWVRKPEYPEKTHDK